MSSVTRRSVLQALTALPVFTSLKAAAAGTTKKRLLIFTTPNGTVMNEFWPTSTTYPSILAPLQRFQAKTMVVRGIDNKGAVEVGGMPGHIPDFPSMLTGSPPGSGSDYGGAIMTGPSIDQTIASALGTTTRFASRELGVGAYSGGYNLLARAANQPITPELSPYRAFTTLFSGVMPGTNPTMPDPALVNLLANRKSVLDLVRGEVSDLRCALGRSDQIAFDAHTSALRDLERQVTELPMMPPQQGATCTLPTLGAEVDSRTMANFPKLAQLQMDVAVQAFACDLTRVITLQFHTGASACVHSWAQSSINGTHHGISHNSEGVSATSDQRRAWLLSIERWFADRFAYLLGKLDATADGPGRTLLDNTAVVWLHEQNNGESHQRTDLPVVIAGSCGDALRTGVNTQFNGKSMNDLCLTLAKAMDVNLTTFGKTSYVSGPLLGLMR